MKPKVNYTTQDLLDKFGGTKVKCALTGRDLDLTLDKYCLDHIIPVDRGGSNELSNMEITCPEANAAKNNLTNSELIDLCIEILTNFGYKVSN